MKSAGGTVPPGGYCLTVMELLPGHVSPVVGISTAITIPSAAVPYSDAMRARKVVLVVDSITTPGVYIVPLIVDPADTTSSITIFSNTEPT